MSGSTVAGTARWFAATGGQIQTRLVSTTLADAADNRHGAPWCGARSRDLRPRQSRLPRYQWQNCRLDGHHGFAFFIKHMPARIDRRHVPVAVKRPSNSCPQTGASKIWAEQIESERWGALPRAGCRSFPRVSPIKSELPRLFTKYLILLVGARGFEPPTPSLPD